MKENIIIVFRGFNGYISNILELLTTLDIVEYGVDRVEVINDLNEIIPLLVDTFGNTTFQIEREDNSFKITYTLLGR
jgi:hypothetical protein